MADQTMVAIIVVTNWLSSYRRALSLANLAGDFVYPVVRIKPEIEATDEDTKQMIQDLVANILNTEFNDIKFKTMTSLGHIRNDYKEYYLIECEGWPEPKENHKLYTFVNPFNKTPTGNLPEIFKRIDKIFAQKTTFQKTRRITTRSAAAEN